MQEIERKLVDDAEGLRVKAQERHAVDLAHPGGAILGRLVQALALGITSASAYC
jgi:hypothetical protein